MQTNLPAFLPGPPDCSRVFLPDKTGLSLDCSQGIGKECRNGGITSVTVFRCLIKLDQQMWVTGDGFAVEDGAIEGDLSGTRSSAFLNRTSDDHRIAFYIFFLFLS